MSDLYWFPMEPLKFISSTNEMTLEEVGAYIRLLCHQWDNGGISLDANRHPIGMAPNYAKDIWPSIKNKFIERDGKYINERLEVCRKEAVAKHEALSKAGRKGGLSRASRVATSPGQASYNNNKSNNKIKSKSKSKKKTYAEKVHEYFAHTITIEKIKEWEEAFPWVDVDNEIRSAKQWLLDNQGQRKKNFTSYLGRWFRNVKPQDKPVSVIEVGKQLAREMKNED